MSYTTKIIDGMELQTQKLPDRSLKFKIAKYVIGVGFWFMFVCLLQLITTMQATRVMDYQVAHSFVPVK